MGYVPVNDRVDNSTDSTAPSPKLASVIPQAPIAKGASYVPVAQRVQTPATSGYTPVAQRTAAAPTPTTQPFSAVDKAGNSFGFSPETDVSGKNFFAYRAPGDTSTTTDKTRVATTFDPRVAAPQTKDSFYNPRAVDLRAKLKDALGIAYSDQLDHQIALELSGSNDVSNLKPIPTADNQANAQKENTLAKAVADGSMSLFDAQVQEAKNKGIKVPFTGKQSSWLDKVKGFLGGVGEGIKNIFGSKVEAAGYVPVEQRQPTPTDFKPNEAVNKLGVFPQTTVANSTAPTNSSMDTIGFLKTALDPNGKTATPNLLFTTEDERKAVGDLVGPRIVTEPAKFIYNTVAAFVNAVPQFAIDTYSALKTAQGKDSNVTLPFNPERLGFSKDDILKGTTVKSITNSTLDRLEELDKNQPKTPNLNLVQAFTEKVLNRAILNPIISGDVAKSATETFLQWSKSSPQLGLSATKLKDLPPQDAVQEVATRFSDRAKQIIADNSSADGTLSSYGKSQINALISETKALGQAFSDQSIPQLNSLGQFFDNAAIRLNQDVGNLGIPTSLLSSKINPAEETLPGYQTEPAPAMGLSIQKKTPVGFGGKPEEFKGFEDLSTTVLEKLKGRDTVSKQYISDLTNSPDLKQSERDVIRKVLDNEKKVKIAQYTDSGKEGKFWTTPEGADSGYGSVKKEAYVDSSKLYKGSSSYDFLKERGLLTEDMQKVMDTANESNDPNIFYKVTQDKAEEVLKKEGYAGAHWTGEDDLNPTQYQVWDKSAISTSADINVKEFADKVKAELLPLKRRSAGDAYEPVSLPDNLKGEVDKYEAHIYNSPIKTSAGDIHFGAKSEPSKNYFGHTRTEDIITGPNKESDTRRIIEVQSDLYQKGGLENERAIPAQVSESEMSESGKEYHKNRIAQRDAELVKLKQYSNPTAHFRMVREEIKQAAIDGKTKLQFPTGETAMKIEGLGQEGNFTNGFNDAIKPDDLKIGQQVFQGGFGSPWIVTDVLGDGKFQAMPKEYFDSYAKSEGIDNLSHKDLIYYAEEHASSNFWGSNETFDISGKIDTSNPIYKFYEKDLGRYLTNKYGAKVITDKQGVKWYELNVPKEAAKQPVTAFKKHIFSRLTGKKISIEQAKKLIFKNIPENEVKLIFTDSLIDGIATGQYKGGRDGMKDILKPMIKLYEEAGKVSASDTLHESGHYIFDNFLSSEEKQTALDAADKQMGALTRAKYKLTGYNKDQVLEEYIVDQYAKQKAREDGYTGRLASFFEKLDAIIKKIIDAIKKVAERIKGTPNKQGGFVKNFFDEENNPLNIKIEEYKELESGGRILDPNAKTPVGDFSISNKALKHFVEQRTAQGANIKKATGFLFDTLNDPDFVAPNKKTPDTTIYIKRIPNEPKKVLAVVVNKNNEIITIHYKRYNQFENLKNQLIATGRSPFPEGKPSSFSPEGDLAARRISALQKRSTDSSTTNIRQSELKVNEAQQSATEQQLSQLQIQKSALEEALASDPAKQLAKYANSNGELPQVLGGAGGVFGKTGDQIVTELGFKDSEEARAAYQNYRLQKARLGDLNERIKQARGEVVNAKRELKDVKSLSSLLNKTASKTEKQIASLASAEGKTTESKQEISQRKAMARDRMNQILKKTYGALPPLQKENLASTLDTIEMSHNITLQEFERSGEGDPYQQIIIDTNTPVKDKVGILDYLRTPDRVLKKIGLAGTFGQVRTAYENYLAELPSHIDLIKKWASEVPGKGANLRIFRWLDGQANRDYHAGKVMDPLSPTELTVAREIRQYLRVWADRLGLPEDNKISHYITHIFALGENEKEFDEDIAKIIRERVPGSVYDPFLEKRLGKKGYIEDTWKALDAYVKRAVRKANMDPVLERLKTVAKRLEESQANYIMRFAQRVNLQPTEVDNLLDNTLKQFVGYKFGQRPVAFLSRAGRQLVYRAMLGLNVGSAVKNLSQGVNTFAKIGPKYTAIGYSKLLTQIGSKELEEVGILKQDLIQDKTLSATRQMLEKTDKALFAMFEMAEKINRGSAYFGAKAQAIAKGATEPEAIEYAKKIVRDTQFQFGSIDTAVGLNSDVVKLLTQFMSYGIKQTEFFAEMAKNKEWGGLLRYIAASLAIVIFAGKALNFKFTDFVPGYSFTKFGLPPLLNLPTEIVKALLDAPDNFGNKRTPLKKVFDVLKAVPLPATIQVQKTTAGLQTILNPKNGIEQTPYAYSKATLLGAQNLPTPQKTTTQNELDQKQTDHKKAVEAFRPIFNQIHTMAESGNKAEADKLYYALSPADRLIYDALKTAAKAQATKDLQQKISPIYEQAQKLKADGKQAQADALYNNLTEDERHAYDLLKKRLSP